MLIRIYLNEYLHISEGNSYDKMFDYVIKRDLYSSNAKFKSLINRGL